MQKETLFLKVVIIVLALAVLTGCIFAVPGLIQAGNDFSSHYRYVFYGGAVGVTSTAILFWIIIWQAFKILILIDHDNAFSQTTIKILRLIKWLAVAMGVVYALELPSLYVLADHMDAPGVLMIGIILTGASIVISVFAALLEKLLANAVNYKSENDLTI
ncbi:hypothetical protein LOOC260_112390 [Paucilactobacillus hokkaidonensis JCM 18461]|uniref:DUF2975 domain-containing protein n=2 Tax=Paucilactobacillus hokkaidonensis TaxID=1193095 RepID=A0A0A1GU40_9LACO|nr:DUF2975 domain-containing protein [Paucilactobacillus hokkaidonensis]KRO10323.1 hypothetical protein IV59_GL001941 [Paucilactobacillus hokkaidonensis]BAP85777.1 hypothetical protein LOOC260_112390 [Paucilactobacillus hokkaidonensis JCM 18461]